MNGNSIGIIVNTIFIIIGTVILTGTTIKMLKNSFSPVKSINATVTDKQTYLRRTFHLKTPNCEQKYIITFMSGKKKLSFYVSPFSYNGYKINQTGILKYKGTKLIDFK